MKVAVMYSGALRTIRKTMRYFKQNVLINSDVHVFVCVQNDTSQPNSEWEDWIRTEMGNNLKSLVWFDSNNYQDWISVTHKNIDKLHITDSWKYYLKNSGSTIEYLQLDIAYKNMYSFEYTNVILYDYIIRCRTDNIFAKPIDFHWLNWTDEEVENRINLVKDQLEKNSIDINNDNLIRYFMNTIINDSLINNIGNINANNFKGKNYVQLNNYSEINQFIKKGAYILTIRANNLYIVRRDYFYLIPALSSYYGFLKSPYSDDYWFNAENQFQATCYHLGLTIFNYNTVFEDKSLYEYDEKRYFDENFNLINPNMLYCLIRN